MAVSQNNHVALRQPRPWTCLSGVLLFLVLTSTLALPSASAAGATPDTISETVSEVAAAAEPVTAPATSTVAPAPPSTPAPPPVETPAPTPVPSPPAAAKPVTEVVDRALDSGPGSPAAQVVREPVRQVTETVDAVIEESGAIPVAAAVEDSARRTGAAASSLAGRTAEGTRTIVAPQPPSPPISGIGNRPAGKGDTAPAAQGAWAEPSPPADQVFSLPVPRGDVHLAPPEDVRLTLPENASSLSFVGAPTLPVIAADARRTIEAAASSVLSGDEAEQTGAPSHGTPSPAAPVDAAASAPLGGAGFTSFVLLLLGLLAGFALAVPRIPGRRMAAGCRYRSTLFVCVLERPG